MKKIRIIALHLAYGGIEKAIISMANLFAEKYDVEIISVYNMPDSPAFPLSERVRVRYLLDETPNREEFRAAMRAKDPAAILREGIKSVRILREKKRGVINTIKDIGDGVIITTRNEDNVLLSRYGSKNVLKIAQLHHDHRFDKRLVRDISRRYGNIDVFALLTEGLAAEVRAMLPEESRTRVVCVPNFLEHYPENIDLDAKKKVALAVGRLDAVKGFDRLVEAFADIHGVMPDWKLRIVGEGTERDRLELLISENGLEDCVSLTGMRDAAGVEEEMRRASLFLMSSHSEGLPFVLMEAFSAMLPAVAYDVRVGPGAIIQNGVSGYLVPDGDRAAYVARVYELMGDEEKRREMAERALERSHFYSKENVARIWDGVLGD
ncbi:MAG: glycosyltransferase [Eubacteriales bacterium]|nr:glycosyltransferase [Eubacteriales bacterium]